MKKFLQLLPRSQIKVSIIESIHPQIEVSIIESLHPRESTNANTNISSRHSSSVSRNFYDFLDELNWLLSQKNEIISLRFLCSEEQFIFIDLLTGYLRIHDSIDLLPLKELASANLIGTDRFIKNIQFTFKNQDFETPHL